MKKVIWDKKEIDFPESWDEMNEEQLLLVSKHLGGLLFQDEVDEKELYAQRIIMLQKFLGLPLWKFKRVNNSQLVDLLALFDFLKKIDLNEQLIPEIEYRPGIFGKKKKLYGPMKGMKSSTLDEFIMADTNFVKISAQQQFDFAYNLFAMLYRPEREDIEAFKASKDYNGDHREVFNSTKCNERVKMFKKSIPKEYIIAVMYFYWGFREKNLLIYKTLFPTPPKDENGEPKKQVNAKPNYGWAATRLEISGGKFGNFKETGESNWRTVIFDMHLREEKRIERERQAAFNRVRNKR